MSDKKCPNCRLYNPPSAIRCDCGYDFETASMKRPYLVKHSLTAITTSSLWATVILKTLYWTGIIVGWGLMQSIMGKTLGIGGAIPNMVLAVPFLFGAIELYKSRGGKPALLVVMGMLAILLIWAFATE